MGLYTEIQGGHIGNEVKRRKDSRKIGESIDGIILPPHT